MSTSFLRANEISYCFYREIIRVRLSFYKIILLIKYMYMTKLVFKFFEMGPKVTISEYLSSITKYVIKTNG